MAETNRHTRLQRLKNSGFEMSGSEPDIRGWTVRNSDGAIIGEVDDLIFDMQDQKVRYLVLQMAHNDLTIPARQVLVPIGIAEIHEKEDDVILTGITHAQLAALPGYDEERFDTEHEESVFNVFGGLGAAALSGGSSQDKDFYEHSHFSAENLYKNRRNTEIR